MLQLREGAEMLRKRRSICLKKTAEDTWWIPVQVSCLFFCGYFTIFFFFFKISGVNYFCEIYFRSACIFMSEITSCGETVSWEKFLHI